MSIMAFHAVPSAPPAVPEGAQLTRTLPHMPELQVIHQEWTETNPRFKTCRTPRCPKQRCVPENCDNKFSSQRHIPSQRATRAAIAKTVVLLGYRGCTLRDSVRMPPRFWTTNPHPSPSQCQNDPEMITSTTTPCRVASPSVPQRNPPIAEHQSPTFAEPHP